MCIYFVYCIYLYIYNYCVYFIYFFIYNKIYIYIYLFKKNSVYCFIYFIRWFSGGTIEYDLSNIWGMYIIYCFRYAHDYTCTVFSFGIQPIYIYNHKTGMRRNRLGDGLQSILMGIYDVHSHYVLNF